MNSGSKDLYTQDKIENELLKEKGEEGLQDFYGDGKNKIYSNHNRLDSLLRMGSISQNENGAYEVAEHYKKYKENILDGSNDKFLTHEQIKNSAYYDSTTKIYNDDIFNPYRS